jgi:hypothetical protein
MPYVASFSGLSNFDCPSGHSNRIFYQYDEKCVTNGPLTSETLLSSLFRSECDVTQWLLGKVEL